MSWIAIFEKSGFSPETRYGFLWCFGLLLIIQGKTGIKSKTHFHTPYKSRSWKCAWLEQVKGGVVCTLPRVSKPIFLPIFRGFRGVFGYFSMLCPTAYSTSISYSLPLFCLSNLDFQVAKFERLSVVFVRVGDIVSHFYHGSRYGFKPIK